MVQKLKDMKTESDKLALDALVKNYRDLYADYGICRQKEIQYHLKELEKLSIPTQSTKCTVPFTPLPLRLLFVVVVWLYTSIQNGEFYKSKQSPLFNTLSQELNLTEEQIEKIHLRRERIELLLRQLKESLALITELQSAITAKHDTFDEEIGKMADKGTSEQRVKLLLWIKNNEDSLAAIFPEYEDREKANLDRALVTKSSSSS